MPEISMKNMLSAGVHFGHQTHRWNPKMKPYIFAPRNGIYIIDLEKTVQHAQKACEFIRGVVTEGGKVLFVATKRQAKDKVKEAAERANMPYVNERWLGGTLTNFQTIRRGVEKLQEIEMMKEDGTYSLLPKKETVRLERKREKLLSSLGGIRHMRSLPQVLFVIDPETEKNAVREANRLGVPVVALVDTNCDPDLVDFVIPGNDDAMKSVSLFLDLIAESCSEGAAIYENRVKQMMPKQETTPSEDKTASQGPVVERVVRRQLKIPTEIDYRADEGVEEETPATTGEQDEPK